MRMRDAVAGLAGLLAAWGIADMTFAVAPPRVMSLDQCADQYVLALSSRTAVVGLSPRALNSDSFLAAQAAGLPIRRADSEAALAANPQVVIRYWGGDPGLLRDLARQGVRIVTIDDATDFPGIRRNVRRVAGALGRPAAGEALIRNMDVRLAASRGAWRGRTALYLTSLGATAGHGTLIDSMMEAAGLRNLAHGAGFHIVSLEQLALDPPSAVVEGFFDPPSGARVHWGPGRHGALRRLTAGRTLVSLPGALLGCPAWFAADAVEIIAAAAPGRCPATSSKPTTRCV
jgi:iron complex transport system substrate-binding protein